MVQAYSVKQNSSVVLLATALIKVKNIFGTQELLRALIDPGSQATIITNNAARVLGLPREKAYLELTGVGNTQAGTTKGQIQIEIAPRFSSNFKICCDALILSKLTKTLPNDKIQLSNVDNILQNNLIADPTFNKPGPIDIIIGADIYADIILNGIKKISNGLIAQNTSLGWIISGRINAATPFDTKVVNLVTFTDLSDQLHRFWNIEEVNQNTVNEKELDCELQYKQTCKRNKNGTYTVSLPLRQDVILGDSKKQAVASLLQMEKKFKTNPKLAAGYKQFMKEYLELGHMVPTNITPDQHYIIPHQAVIKESSTTTKLGVVFDATAKSSNGKSLNSYMYARPGLQQTLGDVLLRWRKHKYAFTADVEKMYRQIKISDNHQNLQKIVWRFNSEEPIQKYNLTTVTYGTTSAPYLAVRTLHQLASDEKHTYPIAAKIAMKDFYVDDLLSGADTLAEAQGIQSDIIHLLRNGGFNLRKWIVNDKELLNSIPKKSQEYQKFEISEDNTTKTLGILWKPVTDEFIFKVKLDSSNIPATKRNVLSTIARIYGPLGWLGPVIIKAKLFMQELWVNHHPWDEQLSPDLLRQWNQFTQELPDVEEIILPRWLNTTHKNSIELHGFSDASERAYGASVYAKTVIDGKVKTSLVTAKSRVTPLKTKHTLPRLELCAAVLLSKLMVFTKKSLELDEVKEFAWSDSQITLAWIKGDPERWEPFIASRVNEINSNIEATKWHNVKSEDN